MHAGVWVCGVGVGCGDLRIQSWNVNSMKKSQKTWLQFVNKVRNSTEEIFVIVDSRLEKTICTVTTVHGQSYLHRSYGVNS